MRSFRAALVFFAASFGASGGTYYVDRLTGNDANNGVSISSAWQTIAKVNGRSFTAGDFILLRRDRVWNEQLIVPSSGTADQPITFGAYGLGSAPVLDGTSVLIPQYSALLTISGKSNITVTDLELRNSSADGLGVYQATGIRLQNCSVHDSRLNGMNLFDMSYSLVSGCNIYNNSLDTSMSYAGIRLNGSSSASEISIIDCAIHNNMGGRTGFADVANGIEIGNTNAPPEFQNLVISGNDIYLNGNFAQTQAGRGITGSFTGDITVTKNSIYKNSASGMYVGNDGLSINITATYNHFTDNGLRSMGGLTSAVAVASYNTFYCSDPAINCIGMEVGGSGVWQVQHNVFVGSSNSPYTAFIRIHDAAQDAKLQANNNLYYSTGVNTWKRSDGIPLTFVEWQLAGYDHQSVNVR